MKLTWYPPEEIPADSTPILVWLKHPSLGRYIHSAVYNTNKMGQSIGYIGHYFTFDVPEVVAWAYAPEGPNGESPKDPDWEKRG